MSILWTTISQKLPAAVNDLILRYYVYPLLIALWTIFIENGRLLNRLTALY